MRIIVCLLFCACLMSVKAQDNGTTDNAMSPVALSVNPLGFLQFGPMVNLEFGIKNVVINTHARVGTLGLLSYVVNYHEDGLAQLSSYAFGGGPIIFMGKKQSRPYIGLLGEFDKTYLLNAEGEEWEWEKDMNTIVIALNGGYRFRFNSGFFINTGAYLGAAISQYEWGYTDESYYEDSDPAAEGSEAMPFGMLEVTFGIEF